MAPPNAPTLVFTLPGVMQALDPAARLALAGRSQPGLGIAGSWTDFGDGLVPGLMDRAKLNNAVLEAIELAKSFGDVSRRLPELAKAHGLDAHGTKILMARASLSWKPHEKSAPKLELTKAGMTDASEKLAKAMSSWSDKFQPWPDLHLKALKLVQAKLGMDKVRRDSRAMLDAERKTLTVDEYEKRRSAFYQADDQLCATYNGAQDALEAMLLEREVADAEKRAAPALDKQDAFKLEEGEIEIPDWLGEPLLQVQEMELLKGAGHKYIRRTPTGVPGRYRYVYKVTAGSGQTVEDHHIVPGAKFQGKDGSKKGHFHVDKVVGGKVHLTHDESGKTHVMDHAALRAMVEKGHAQQIKAEHKDKGLKSIGKTKSGKHIFAPTKAMGEAIGKHIETQHTEKGSSKTRSTDAEKAALQHLDHHADFTPAEHKEASKVLAAHGKGDKVYENLAASHKLAAKHPTLVGDLKAKHAGVTLAHPSKMVKTLDNGKHAVTHGPDGKKLEKPKSFMTKQEATAHATKAVEAHRKSLGMPDLNGNESQESLKAKLDAQQKTSDDKWTARAHAEKASAHGSKLAEEAGKVVGRAALGDEDITTGAKGVVGGAAADLKQAKIDKAKKEAEAASKKLKKSDDAEDDDALEKAEGDHGGHVIGHTSSNKPIYAPTKGTASNRGFHKKHPSTFDLDKDQQHRAWSSKDHHEAKAVLEKTPKDASVGGEGLAHRAELIMRHGQRAAHLGRLNKSGEPMTGEELRKAESGTHKYISRKMDGKGGWTYAYADARKGPGPTREEGDAAHAAGYTIRDVTGVPEKDRPVNEPTDPMGHTQSGKTVFNAAGAAAHESFSVQDHHDAAAIHRKDAAQIMKDWNGAPKGNAKLNHDHALEQAGKHDLRASIKSNMGEPMGPGALGHMLALAPLKKSEGGGHKYLSRKPDGAGGYSYVYAVPPGSPEGTAAPEGAPAKHEIRAYHEMHARRNAKQAAEGGPKAQHHLDQAHAHLALADKADPMHERAIGRTKSHKDVLGPTPHLVSNHWQASQGMHGKPGAGVATSKAIQRHIEIEHKGFSAEDHKDAAELHRAEADRVRKDTSKGKHQLARNDKALIHTRLADHHDHEATKGGKGGKGTPKVDAPEPTKSTLTPRNHDSGPAPMNKSATAQENTMSIDTEALAGLDKLIKSGSNATFAEATAGAESEVHGTDALAPHAGRTASPPSTGGGSVEAPANPGGLTVDHGPLHKLEPTAGAIQVTHLGGADDVFASWASANMGAAATSLDFSDWQNPHAGAKAKVSGGLDAEAPPVNNDLTLRKAEGGDDEDDDETDPDDLDLSLTNKAKADEALAKSQAAASAVRVTSDGFTVRVSNDVDRRATALVKSQQSGNFVDFTADEKLTKSFGARGIAVPLGNLIRVDQGITDWMNPAVDPFIDP